MRTTSLILFVQRVSKSRNVLTLRISSSAVTESTNFTGDHPLVFSCFGCAFGASGFCHSTDIAIECFGKVGEPIAFSLGLSR